jgi:hypothetical protein
MRGARRHDSLYTAGEAEDHGRTSKKDGAVRSRGANDEEDDKGVADVTWARRENDAKRTKNADSRGSNEKEEERAIPKRGWGRAGTQL